MSTKALLLDPIDTAPPHPLRSLMSGAIMVAFLAWVMAVFAAHFRSLVVPGLLLAFGTLAFLARFYVEGFHPATTGHLSVHPHALVFDADAENRPLKRVPVVNIAWVNRSGRRIHLILRDGESIHFVSPRLLAEDLYDEIVGRLDDLSVRYHSTESRV